MFKVNPKRVRLLKQGVESNGSVLYWMSRDQRVHNNWALIFAQQLAEENRSGLIVVFNLVPDFLGATIRQYLFMLNGLQELEKELLRYNIPFTILFGSPEKNIPEFTKANNISYLVTDFDPLKNKQDWKRKISQLINIPFFEVDAHNVVPCFYVSKKQEFGAYTLRPKIHKVIEEFLDEYSSLKEMTKTGKISVDPVNWNKISESLNIDRAFKEDDWLKPGENNAQLQFENFLNNSFENYSLIRNDPSKEGLSNLSPFLHFGQISSQQIALQIKKRFLNHPSAESFLEELIVRKELSDNFCFYNENYDSFAGFPEWAKKTLNDHRKDEREFIYSVAEFENAQTHDELWNAAQIEMLTTGKMHGYMRMYWAKKILEWTATPEDALKIAIYLNDKYELDGRDPNGYTGCAWAIGGLHDRAWFERPVFGKIRYMNAIGARKKFDVDSYINKHKISA
jgi:deoxyribodipyrimidine photo-lyase